MIYISPTAIDTMLAHELVFAREDIERRIATVRTELEELVERLEQVKARQQERADAAA